MNVLTGMELEFSIGPGPRRGSFESRVIRVEIQEG